MQQDMAAATGKKTPHSLRDALAAAKHSDSSTPMESAGEEDYDEITSEPKVAVLVEGRVTPAVRAAATLHTNTGIATPSDTSSELDAPISCTLLGEANLHDTKVYSVASDDKELREILRRGLKRAADADDAHRHTGKFRDFVFSSKFSTFDKHNVEATSSIFHGFYILLWIGVVLGMLKIAAENWRRTGSVLGTNDIMRYMFRRDVVVLLMSDGLMCSLTGVSWVLQLLVLGDVVDWDTSGWILQNMWQTLFIAGGIAWTQLRDWPWSHTVFFVMHILIMLMKQHSYAFYNGYLSTVYKKKHELSKTIQNLDNTEQVEVPSRTDPPANAVTTSHLASQPTASQLRDRRRSVQHQEEPSELGTIAAAIDSGQPLDSEQIKVFRKVIDWELAFLDEELKGKATDASRAYPNNLTFVNFYEYIPLPTVVYELEYPRSSSIDWYYVAERFAATFGVIFVMMMISQAFIYPVVIQAEDMKASGMLLRDRLHQFPWMFSDLLFPLMMEFLLSWYVIWEQILNLLAELTYFADRTFYNDWWNSVSWDQYARDWNRPVHNFLLRHVYHSSISALKVDKYTATLITFFLSACVHELIMWCIFKKLRGYLLLLQMSQLPLVALSRTKYLRGRKTLGNAIFWAGIFTGPSMLCSLYLIL